MRGPAASDAWSRRGKEAGALKRGKSATGRGRVPGTVHPAFPLVELPQDAVVPHRAQRGLAAAGGFEDDVDLARGPRRLRGAKQREEARVAGVPPERMPVPRADRRAGLLSQTRPL